MSILAKVKPGFRPGANGLQSLGSSVKSIINGGGGGWWDMEEDMFDYSENGNTLSEINTPTYVAIGKPGNYVQLTAASTQYGTVGDNASLSAGAGKYLTCGGWIYLSTAGTPRHIISKGTNASLPALEYLLRFTNSSTKLGFYVGDGTNTAEVQTSAGISLSTWTFVAAKFDLGAGKIYISLNMGAWAEASFPYLIQNGTNVFRIGASTTGGSLWDGRLDSLFVAISNSRCLTDAELTYIKNGTTGRRWTTL